MSGRLSFQTQLASIMEVLANAAVAEICKLVEDDYAVVSLQMSQCQRENKALKRKLHLLEIKMARGTAERRLRESAAGSGRPRVLLSGAERPREAADTSRASGACFSSRDTCTDGTFGGQMDVVLWSDQAAAGDAELIHTKQEQTKSPDVQLVEVDEAQLKVEKVEADMSRVTELEDDLEEVLIKDDGLVEPLPRGSGPRLTLQHQDHQTTSSRTQTSTTTPSLGGRRRRSGSRGVEKKEEEEEDVVLVKVEQVRAEPESLEQVRAEPQSDSSLSIQEGLVESSTDDFRATLSYDDVTQSSTNQLPDLQDSGRSLPESAESTPVVSRDPVSMAGVRLRVPDKIPDSERTRIRPRTRTSSGSEFSLFDLESFFTRWAPDPEPTAAPGGPSCSFTNHNSAPSQQDHVIVLENEAQYVVRAPQEAAGRQSGVPQTGSHAGPSVPLPLRIQAPPPQPHWSRSSSLMRSRSSAPTTAPSPPSHSSKAASGGPGEQRRRNYMCRTCGKAFSGVSNLEAHRRVHTGEKPFRCATCGKHFSEAGNLKKHQRVHTGEKPFSCERCGKKFAWICNLRTHQQSSTGCGGGGA